MESNAPERFVGHLSIDAAAGPAFSDARIRLLEAIGQLGSISRAARAVPLSYKAAWDALDTMNNLSPEPLVARVTGGRQGGGTQLTDYGRRVIAMYRALELETRHALERAAGGLAGGAAGIDDFRRLMQRMSLRTSARNQFSGTVVALRNGEVDYEVRLALDRDTELVAVITRASAERLGLAIGKEALAFVKSSSVLIATERDVRYTARNQFWGEVAAIHEGSVNDEITVALPAGKRITAVVSRASREALGLAQGSPACALFKSSSVIVAAFD